MIMLNLFLECLLSIYMMRNKVFLVIFLNQKYRLVNNMDQLFDQINAIVFSFYSLQYLFGFYAVFSHRVFNFQIMRGFIALGVIFRAMLLFFNGLNAYMIIIKVITFVYLGRVVDMME